MDDIFNLQDDEIDLSDEEILATFQPQLNHVIQSSSKQTSHQSGIPIVSKITDSFACKTTCSNLINVSPKPINYAVHRNTEEVESLDETSNQRYESIPKTPRLSTFGIGLENTPSPARKRKFPGPAGILPVLSASPILENQLQFKHRKRKSCTPSKDQENTLLDDRDGDCDFNKGLWPMLKQAANDIKRYPQLDIANILKMASQHTLKNGKVPLLVVLLKSFTFTEGDAVALLIDPSGEIRSTVHKGVLEQHQSDLIPGAGLVLCQISVFSPNAKRHYINITPSNVVKVISPSSTSKENENSQQEISFHEELARLQKTSPVSNCVVSKSINNSAETSINKDSDGKSSATGIKDAGEDCLIEFDDDDFLIDEELLGF